ncbi:hypothetical protein U746_0479 [Mycolicibacterium mucogenicum 261Sha1.1M5]|uniref:DUF8094 domain-containing protein n=1 Tax=Leucobacter aridicollis TaxID=283878 RepID=A0A852R9S9_9MICO|nr:hypothetical protein [Leucobacter aridicollis]MBL3681801.1 hypothetical protein [Leucobacter aridicollis]NYD27159.1 hypothetical protein [Leucobacter aridicollis]RKQ94726.1 hypothetical protein U746_0479 [Mycolicibacterium mucogenicum 261Sha1.1M5]
MRNKTRRHASTRALLAGLGLTAALAVSGCSANYWPDFEPTPEATAESDTPEQNGLAPVPVSEAQTQKIIDRVASAAEKGDASLNPDDIAERFKGDALAQRTANYKIRSEVSDYGSVPAKITNEMLGYRLVQSTEVWPRTMFVTVASEAGTDADGNVTDAPSLALILTQRIPQADFRVSRVISLRGGLDMPKAAPAEEGTALLSDDIESLVLKPADVGTAYAAILQGGADVEAAAPFDLTDDPLLDHYGKAWVDESKAKSDAEDKTQKYSVSVAQGEEPIVSFSTGAGGALIATTVIESQVVDSDGGRYKPQAEGAVSALSGLKGQQDKIVRRVAHQLLFFVPSKEDGSQIQLLGVTSELVGAGK